MSDAGPWLKAVPGAPPPSGLPRAPSTDAGPTSLFDVTLDSAQRSVVDLPPDRAVLVLGDAGYGKTSVALHRMARVLRERARNGRAAILVPSAGLVALLQPLVRRLGLDVEVRTYDVWAAREARRAFRDLPKRESRDARASVLRVKRDPALRPLLAELASEPPGRIDDDRDAPRVRTRAFAQRADLQHLFGDALRMRRLRALSAHALSERAIEEVLEHTRVQFSRTTEDAWSHVTDRERLVAVDRLALDEGTPDEDAASVDIEDFAVLFALDAMRAARAGQSATAPRAYDCILLDEAQELAPLELELVGRALRPERALIVAGDADQQMDPTAFFQGWDGVMAELGRPQHARAALEVSYRCPPEVVRLARTLLEPGGLARAPALGLPSEAALIAWLAGEADALDTVAPEARTAIVWPLGDLRPAPRSAASRGRRAARAGRTLHVPARHRRDHRRPGARAGIRLRARTGRKPRRVPRHTGRPPRALRRRDARTLGRPLGARDRLTRAARRAERAPQGRLARTSAKCVS
jgi:hypothetical protein